MRINVVAIGKIKESGFQDAIGEYIKRCSRFGEVCVTELQDAPPSKSQEEQKRIESARLMDAAKGYVVAMDSSGESITSEGLAALIKGKAADGVRELCFLIGGSHGHTEELKACANAVISFGKITFPHQLFRVVLCEQIYRALSINAGCPYHK